MFPKKKIATMASMLSFVIVCVSAVTIPLRNERNLKVLPMDISNEKLDSFMNVYSVALGVDCKFCHTTVIGFPDSIDFRSDSNPMKENARDMMKMVIDINSRYFYYDTIQRPVYLRTVTCKNCHQGHPIPPDNH